MAQMESLWALDGSNRGQADCSSRADIQNAEVMSIHLDQLPTESCCYLKLKPVNPGVRRGLQAHLQGCQCFRTKAVVSFQHRLHHPLHLKHLHFRAACHLPDSATPGSQLPVNLTCSSHVGQLWGQDCEDILTGLAVSAGLLLSLPSANIGSK